MPQPSITTGFPALDQLLGENTDYFGIPRGGVTAITGQTGSGKSLLLRKIAENAHAAGLHVAYLDPELRRPVKPTSYDYISTDDIESAREFLRVHTSRYDLIVIDHYNSFIVPDSGDGVLAYRARTATNFFHRAWGVTAAIAGWQTRRSTLEPVVDGLQMPVGVGYNSNLTLSITNEVAAHTINITKNRWGASGVGCSVYLNQEVSKPKPVKEVYIPTRFERVLRGDRR
jgi:energy-coupling factor transporter ATP-binding protein EcfA2